MSVVVSNRKNKSDREAAAAGNLQHRAQDVSAGAAGRVTGQSVGAT